MRVSTNISSLVAQRASRQRQDRLDESQRRLATGLRVERGRDGPAKLIASENLRNHQTRLEATGRNAERARAVLSTAEAGLASMGSMLLDLRSRVTERANAGGLSVAEKAALDNEVGQILDGLDRASSRTQFNDTPLLDGRYSVSTAAGSLETTINTPGFFGSADVTPTTPAGTASFQVTQEPVAAAAALDFTPRALPWDRYITFQRAGDPTVHQINFKSNDPPASIQTAIQTALAGHDVTVAVPNDDRIEITGNNAADGDFTIEAYEKFLFNPFTLEDSATGVATPGEIDVAITGGGTSTVQSFDNAFSGSASGTPFDITIAPGSYSTGTTGSLSWATPQNSVGGPLAFALTGDARPSTMVSIQKIDTRSLGSSTMKLAVLREVANTGSEQAFEAVDAAIKQVATMRGRLGATLRYEVDTLDRAARIGYERATNARGDIRDADFAAETSERTRNSILNQFGTTIQRETLEMQRRALSLLA